jgi:hypothetical protein
MLITLLKEEISVVEDTRPGGPEPKVKNDRGLLQSRILLKNIYLRPAASHSRCYAPFLFKAI